jgi:ABC-type multidrug transport system permease subunit
MMAQILAIVRHDLRVFLTNRSNLPSLLLTPAVMTILIGLVTGGAFDWPAARRLDVIDHDRTQSSSQFLASVRQANPGLTLCPMDNTEGDACSLGTSGALTENQALDRVANSTSLAFLDIPVGFEASLGAQQPIALTFHSASSFGVSQPAEEAVKAALAQINAASVASQIGVSALGRLEGGQLAPDQAQQAKNSLYQRALEMGQEQVVSVDLALSGTSQTPTMGQSLQYGLGQSVPGMGTMFVLMTILGGMAALIVEREQWTLQRLAVMPISRGSLLAGKILARFCLGLLQFLVVLIVGALLGMNFGEDPLALMLLLIVYTLSVTALSFAIGSGLKNPAQASGLALLLALTLAPLGGAWWPMAITPRFLQIIGHVSPVAWAMDGFTALTYQGAHLADIWVSLAVLLGITVLAFLIGIPRFQYQVD